MRRPVDILLFALLFSSILITRPRPTLACQMRGLLPFQQSAADSGETDENKPASGIDYWKGYLLDTKYILTSPLRWNKKDWATAFVITGITSGIYLEDQKIQDWMSKQKTDKRDRLARYAEKTGNSVCVAPMLGALYVYGYATDEERPKRAALLSLESMIISNLFAGILKLATHRRRPSSGDPYDTWEGPGLEFSDTSFPSFHAATAFSVAATLAEEYGEITAVPILSYGIATISAISRVYGDKHWASDVFFGSSIGYLTAKTIYKLHSKDTDEASKLMLLPVFGREDFGLTLRWVF